MNNSELFISLSSDIKPRLNLLDDKPEETVESTLKALWFAAAGIPVSAYAVSKLSIPDLNEKQIDTLHHLIELRLNNIPLAHITKRQNFMGLELVSDKRALIPRKETEILGEKALEMLNRMAKPGKILRVIDACCGSGNVGIALAHYFHDCIVYSTDISPDAVELTGENINLLNLTERVHVKQGDVLSAFETPEFFENIDVIVCNPPYILSSQVPKMNSEIVSNEPVLAFDGGMLGIKIIQKLISEAPKYLQNDGWLIFEIGAGQGIFIAQLCERSQLYQLVETVSDDSGIPRVIIAQKAK